MSVAMSSSSLPRTLTVAALQLNSANFDIEGNLKRAVPYVESAARDGAKLILLPEFYSSGYLAERNLWRTAERIDGPTRTWVCSLAKRLKVHLGLTFLEADGAHFFNTFLLAGPDGELAGSTRKHVPAALEAFLFRGTDEEPSAATHLITCPLLGGLRVGVSICYESELAYMPAIAAQADILLQPHCAPRMEALPKSVIDGYDRMVESVPVNYARALGIPVVFANKSGPWESTFLGSSLMVLKAGFCGQSQIVDADGSVLAEPSDEENRTLVATVTIPERGARRPKEPERGLAAVKPARWWKYTSLVDVPVFLRVLFSVDEALGKLTYALSAERAARALATSSGKGSEEAERLLRASRRRRALLLAGAFAAGGAAVAVAVGLQATAAAGRSGDESFMSGDMQRNNAGARR